MNSNDLALVPLSALGIEGDIAPDPDTDGKLYRETSSLETAIRLSLFTDSRAQDGDDLPDNPGFLGDDLRGWWGDAFISDENGSLGSRLWTLKRSALTGETRQRARDYALEALSWLVEIGISSSVEVDANVPAPDRLELIVRIFREAEPPARFAFLWEAV